MSYYEEDRPKLDTSERFGQESLEDRKERMTEEQWMKKIREAVKKDNPLYIPPVDKAEERHREMMEMLGGIFVQISRLYDILLWESPHRAVLDGEHSRGGLYASPPTLRENAWNDDQEDHINEMEDEKVEE